MHVIATAGHVDHGKSTLVRALTGTDPDRLEEEKRRGLSIQLGYCWTALPGAGDVAFVDVPGHERFIATMLSGIGPVPAVLLVVAADDPWMPQAAEHLAALDALGVEHAVVAVTRADLADPVAAAERARREVERTSLHRAPVVTVSGRTGDGLEELRTRLVEMVGRLPVPDPGADLRLWVDRVFHVRGAGTVVTGTLPAGTVSRGDLLSSARATARVRGVQTLGTTVESVSGVARVALNLTGDHVGDLQSGSVLTTPDAFLPTTVLDVRVTGDPEALPARPIMHVGATSVTARTRPLAGDLVRLTLDHALPLRVGDRALLRDPGQRRVWGVRVLDPVPPPLRRRGAATARAKVLATVSGVPDPVAEVARREVVDLDTLRRIGVPAPGRGIGVVASGRWLLSPDRAARVADAVADAVRRHDAASPLDPGLPLAVLADSLGLPSSELVAAVVRPPLTVLRGRVLAASATAFPPAVEQALAELETELRARPFAAPDAERLRELGLDSRAQAAAAKAGRLLRIAPGIVLLPGADRTAVAWLRELPQPFTASDARTRLATSRRVVLPLLDHLDRARLTERLPDDRRRVRA